MIDFNSYERVKLEDVAEFGRAKKGYVYPRGTSTLQISATNGQIGYLHEPSVVEEKHVVIIPSAGIVPKYFNVVLQKNIDHFITKYKTGLNIQERDVGRFPIELHNFETQKVVAEMFEFIEQEEAIVKAEIEMTQRMKENFLNQMMI